MVFVVSMAVLVGVSAAAFMHIKQSRWGQVSDDVDLYASKTQRDTSVGIRIQLWHASWLMFKKSPLVGVGVSNFRHELVELAKQDIVTPLV
ncbi:O-antigen ligase family protein, partial [Achromobacter sp. Marseille-Q0513]|uniref:O-antigen ligase family protein n=1 Tax=Achromobacter sp. Marseille-Q0513 TaxID=2829161 RepID=UPI00201156A6